MISHKSILNAFLIVLACLSGCYNQDNSASQTAVNESTDDSANQAAINAKLDNSDIDSSFVNLPIRPFEEVYVNAFENMFKTRNFDFIRCQTYEGANVLHYAASTGDLNRVKLLLEKARTLTQ